MAFVTATRNGRFEVRESRSTPNGPRSRTLASFAELDEATIAKALARAETPLSAESLRVAALRAGAPLAPRPADRAARDLLRLAKREAPSPMLRRLLLDALGHRDEQGGGPSSSVSEAARSASEWVGVGAEERAAALQDLLLLADALPLRQRPATIDFPRLSSRPA